MQTTERLTWTSDLMQLFPQHVFFLMTQVLNVANCTAFLFKFNIHIPIRKWFNVILFPSYRVRLPGNMSVAAQDVKVHANLLSNYFVMF